MDVKDYSQKLAQSREQFYKAKDDLRAIYDKDTAQIQETSDNKIKKLSKNYDAQKASLEEQNSINNENYSNKTKQAIADKTERFRNELAKNNDRFDTDRNQLKTQFQDQLANLSQSYKKSTDENNRLHDQAMKSMNDHYNKSNDATKLEFDNQISKIDKKSRDDFAQLQADTHKEHLKQETANQENIQKLREDSLGAKFREVSSLRNDNESLREKFEQERKTMSGIQEGRINDIRNMAKAEIEDGQRNYQDLQDNIQRRTKASDEKMKADHLAESKALEKRFNEDLRNVQHMNNQKIKGGDAVTHLKDENKQIVDSYEKRLNMAREDVKMLADHNSEKENKMDLDYREKLRNLKISNNEAMENREQDLALLHNRKISEFKEKNSNLDEHYKSEMVQLKAENDNKLSKVESVSKQKINKERIEFGNYVNNANEKKMEEISSLKYQFAKDKTDFIEKIRKDSSNEKQQIKEGFNQQLALKDEQYEKKLAEMEKQTQKIINNYELRMNQLVKKSEKEVESMKNLEDIRRVKENQSVQITLNNIQRDHEVELDTLRTKYENTIGKDRALNEVHLNQIVQRYEDQLERERGDHQKELSMRLSESQAQLEKLFKQSEQEKDILRNQFDLRLENMKNSAIIKGNTKNS